MPTLPPLQPTPHRWALLIPDWFPPSLNRTSGLHWAQARKHKKKAIELLAVYGAVTGGLPRFEGRVMVQIVRLIGYRQRPYDKDNLHGAVKPLIDAMRREKPGTKEGGLGVIDDDDPDSIDLQLDQRKGLAMGTLEWMRSLGLHPTNPANPGAGLTFGNSTGCGSGTVIVITGKRSNA